MTETRARIQFSFADFADDFDDHIERSIRGYANLIADCKRRHFPDEEILDKEKSLRDKMKPGREADLIEMLTRAGFKS